MFEKFRGGGTIFGSDLETTNGEIFERGVDKFRHRGRLCGLTNLKKREGKREGGREGGREWTYCFSFMVSFPGPPSLYQCSMQKSVH